MTNRKKYKHIAALLFSLIVPLLSYADGETAAIADSLFARKEYSKALPLYMQLQREQPSLTVNQLFRMAVSMTEGSVNQQQAINLLSKLAESPIAPSETWYYLGEANRRMYKFEDAIDYFNIYISRAKDDSELLTQAELQINSCENGLQMLGYATRINRIAKKQVEALSFYTIYDTFSGMHIAKKPQAMWMSADSLVKERHPLSGIVFFPEEGSGRDTDVIYFSSYGQDKETGLDIFRIKRIEGNSWGEPEEIAAVNSPFDEILPYITPDGSTLYFASNGHYGMGGFDIYKSEYSSDARTWSVPENLGFPISSPYDDFLFVPDAANRAACFASSRDTNNDELTVYKVEMNVTPERISVSDINEAMAMASFNVDFSQPAAAATSQTIEVPIKELAGNESYVLLVKGAVALSQQLSAQQAQLNELRQQLSSATTTVEKKELEDKIINGEQETEHTQATFSQAQALLSDAEYQFYTNGEQPLIPEDFKTTLKIHLSETGEAEEPKATSTAAGSFGQTALSLQNAPDLTMKQPKLSDADKYRFRTSGKSIILHNEPVPKEGIAYKIRIGIFSKELSEAQLKNLSPVTTEKRGSTTHYYIGLFRTYNDALKALGEVKKKGFKDAVIDAWVNGKTETTSRARAREKQNTQKTTTAQAKAGSKSTVYRVNVAVFGNVPSSIPTLLSSLSGGRDIVRKTNPDGSTTFSVGIFTKQAEAEAIKQSLEAEGVTGIEIVSIEVNS